MTHFEKRRLTIAAAFLVAILCTAAGQAQISNCVGNPAVTSTLQDCLDEYDAVFDLWSETNNITATSCTNLGGGAFSLSFPGTPRFFAVADKQSQGGLRTCSIGTQLGSDEAVCTRLFGLSGSDYSKWKKFVKNTCLDGL